MRIILSSNPYRDKGLRTALEADRILRKAGAETVLCLPFVPKKGDRLDLPRNLSLHQLEEELPRADLLVCFGGDGTILHAARDATLHGVPILGVNMGSVGFMAELERTELSLLVPLAQGHFVTEERMMLDVRVFRGGRPVSQDLALNDAVFSKGSMARVAEVEVWADQTLVQRIMGDGVIVATPTGSRLLHVGGGAHCGALLPVPDRHAGVRPPAGRPGAGAGTEPPGGGSAAPGEPEAPVSVSRWRQGNPLDRRRTGRDHPVPVQDPAGAAVRPEFL